MSTQRSPPGYKLLASVSVLIAVGALLRGVSDGRIDSMLIALVHVPAAYGLWTGAVWGGLAGILAYGVIGGGITILRAGPNPVELLVALGVVALVVGYIYITEGRDLLRGL